MLSESRQTNRALLLGWSVFVVILFLMYVMEVFRGFRTPAYMAAFCAATLIPMIVPVAMYIKDPESEKLSFAIVVCFSVMYGFVLFTANTSAVWTYILPMLSLLVLYHTPSLIIFSGIISLILNLLTLLTEYAQGELPDFFDRDIRIRFFVLLLCYIVLYLATVLYRETYEKNREYNSEIMKQKEELYAQAQKLEIMNAELGRYSQDLLKKNEELREMAMQTIMTIANTIDAKDEYTRGHSRRVAEYSVAIAAEMGYSGDELRDIRFIGLLHDIGKIGVPDNVLNKPGKLTPEEYQLMKEHTVTGGEILKDITMISDLDVGAKYHHERYDGLGYPENLMGEDIPKTARIIGVADAYDAMTSNRVYRRHLDHERVLEELRNGRGKQFDPEACDVLLKLVTENRMPTPDTEDESIEIKQATKILTRVIDKAEEAAIEDIHFDELTGTLSREHGMRFIQNEIAKYGKGSIFVFDIDNFRRVNEKEGFARGDRYLSVTAQEIKKLAKNITVSRFGPDEFVAYLPDMDEEDEAIKAAESFEACIRSISSKDPVYELLSVSIGITSVATEKDRVMVLYQNAGKALFVAKQYGEGSFFYHRIDVNEDDDVAVANSADLKYLIEYLANRNVNTSLDHVPDIEKLYDTVSVLIKNSLERVYIVLFSLRWTGEEPMDIEERNEIMGLLERSVRLSIRGNDFEMRYSNVQHVALLVGLDEDIIRQIINRIVTDFYRTNTRNGIELHYDVADLRTCLTKTQQSEGSAR